MELKERLEYCKICSNKLLDLKVGLTCSLTNEKPTFENKCQDFLEDKEESKRVLELQLSAAGDSSTQNGSLKPRNNKIYGIALLVLGLGVFFIISMIFGGIIVATGVSFIIKGFQQDKVLRANKIWSKNISD